jgi:hypothetical protein
VGGRITFTEKYKKELLDQGSRIPFFFDEQGRWQIMSKIDMKVNEGIPSPDLWDTTLFLPPWSALEVGVHISI